MNRLFTLILSTALLTGCFYSYTHYRPTTETIGGHTQRETLFLNKNGYVLHLSSFIHSDDYSIQVHAEKSGDVVTIDIDGVYLINPLSNITYLPESYDYFIGFTKTDNTDISKSVLSITFSKEVLDSKELIFYLPITGRSNEIIKFTKTTIIQPMTIN